MKSQRIVIATGNAHKVQEIQMIMGDMSVEWISGFQYDPGLIVENGDSYEANAIIKAKAYSGVSGLPALADDSGLEVDALDGLPGIWSNRLFGEDLSDTDKIKELLVRLRDITDSKRTARIISHTIVVY